MKIGEFVVRLDALRVTDDIRKQAVTAHITASRDGAEIAKLYPARWFFRGREDEPTTEVAIRRSFGGDLYIVMPASRGGRAVGDARNHGHAAHQLAVAWLRRARDRDADRAPARNGVQPSPSARVPANATRRGNVAAAYRPGDARRHSGAGWSRSRATTAGW